MKLGVVMLVHTALSRAAQVARHWAESGCSLCIHVDKEVDKRSYEAFVASLSDLEHVHFCKRFRCEWGTWGIIAASQEASRMLLDRYPTVRNVFLASGACLPIRPIEELIDYLAAHPKTDFIESASIKEVPWIVGGLEDERFKLYFPFAWRRQRYLFDRFVDLQRKVGIQRRVPGQLRPHMGSQWWCLTRETLAAILDDPDRPAFDRFFRWVWIPDESYYQTLARRHSKNLQSQSLTLSKFDFQGKPHIFYDDHLQLLRRSDCFVVRKIWPHAELLYTSFLSDKPERLRPGTPNPGKIDRVFSKAVERRTRGRAGLYMHSRFPNRDWENGITANRYMMLQGYTELFEDFEKWLSRVSGTRVHGHIFAPERAEFANGDRVIQGGLSDSAKIRDYNPWGFFTSLIWNTRDHRQCFQFGPRDRQQILESIVRDPNADIFVVSGAWAVPLFHSDRGPRQKRRLAARLQKIEAASLEMYRAPWAKARVRLCTLAEFVQTPLEYLQAVVDESGTGPVPELTGLPAMVSRDGFGAFLQDLRNQGVPPYLLGDYPVKPRQRGKVKLPEKPYSMN